MIRRFNFTDRRKIPHENLRFWWQTGTDGILQFDCQLNLELDNPLDPAAEVFVEAYSGPVVMRFPFGTVSKIDKPSNRLLMAFPPGEKPLFRVKVVNMSDPMKRLLAWAHAISPLTEEERQSGKRSILPVETVDLGQQIWHLKFEGTQPILQLNALITQPRDITAIARESDFIALVYPAIVRQVLQELHFGEEADSVDWTHDWIQFGSALALQPPPDRDKFVNDDQAWKEHVNQWIDDAVRGFCEQNQAKESFVQFRNDAHNNKND